MIDPPTVNDLPAIIRDWRHLHAAAAFPVPVRASEDLPAHSQHRTGRCLLQDNRAGAQGHLSRINDCETYHDIYHAAHLLAALAQHAYLEMDT
jgi:hypothetical protein